MERRAFKRIPVDIQARLFFGNLVYTGIVTNLSGKGMFIRTRMNFPNDSVLVTSIIINQDTLKLPIRIRRTVKSGNNNVHLDKSGIGVELLNPPGEYKRFVDSFITSSNASINS